MLGIWGRTKGGVDGADDAAERELYGVWDYRYIKRWMFAARALLRQRRRAKMSIGVSCWLVVRSLIASFIPVSQNARLAVVLHAIHGEPCPTVDGTLMYTTIGENKLFPRYCRLSLGLP